MKYLIMRPRGFTSGHVERNDSQVGTNFFNLVFQTKNLLKTKKCEFKPVINKPTYPPTCLPHVISHSKPFRTWSLIFILAYHRTEPTWSSTPLLYTEQPTSLLPPLTKWKKKWSTKGRNEAKEQTSHLETNSCHLVFCFFFASSFFFVVFI
ncbi:hypothetical protein B0T19DRAFT_410600 [Cercophora scortea]|uniref:Uncharacterized protein n=1 Tax=Cercophora scortea TaxID=314031 RepID=A0AAE0MLA6_9PEZI|nr:hypothetical protein B0T19DRAFT_410600 [Cercophora scortea]